MVNRHPNLVKIYSYKNIAITTTILVLNAFAFTHLVTKSVSTIMYLIPISLHVGLIRSIKSRPHFIKGSSINVVTNFHM